jgi:hypothetical protein
VLNRSALDNHQPLYCSRVFLFQRFEDPGCLMCRWAEHVGLSLVHQADLHASVPRNQLTRLHGHAQPQVPPYPTLILLSPLCWDDTSVFHHTPPLELFKISVIQSSGPFLQAVSVRTPFFAFCRTLLLKPFVVGVIQSFGNTTVLETIALPGTTDGPLQIYAS